MISYDLEADAWTLSYEPDTSEEIEGGLQIPSGDFTVQAEVRMVSPQAGQGLFWRVGDVDSYWLVRQDALPEPDGTFYTISDTAVSLRIQYESGQIKLSRSSDQVVWDEYASIASEAPTEVGIVLRADPEASILAQTVIAQYRLLSGTPPEEPGETELLVPGVVSAAGPGIMPLLAVGEPWVHGIVGAQLGDLEVDVGRSVRWLEYLTDDLFITDVNLGTQRYWVLNWATTFPDSKHTVTGRNFFYSPENAALFRQEQFEAASKAWNYGDDDWVVWIDGHEGLSFDNRSLPDDYEANLLMSWIYREIERLMDLDEDTGFLPFFVYLNYSDLQNITYRTQAAEPATVQQAVAVPRYLPAGWLPRLFKVSVLRDLDFDWATIDQPVEDPPYDASGVKAQVISYGYAHWNVQDIPAGQTEVPPLTAENDLGWQMRNLLSTVRPIPNIPFGTTWQDPSTDPPSLPGPWAVDTVAQTHPDLAASVEEHGHALPDPACAGIGVPLYDTVLRLNLRDGLWYERGNSGNMPLTWDDYHQVWVPRYSPEEWKKLGVRADSEDPPQVSPLSLKLDGNPGTYVTTADSPYLDFPQAFTLVASFALADWTPATRSVIVSKWSEDDDQRSYYWGVDDDGMVLVISKDGIEPIEFKLVTDLNLAADDPAALGVAFSTHPLEVTDPDTLEVTTTFEDTVRFWRYITDTWVQIGEPLIEESDGTPIFNSTAPIQVGAYDGNIGNAEGLYHWVSIREGVGEADTFGGSEQALMRGDLELDPVFDRYYNVWNNFGGCSYEEMENPPL